MPGSSTSRRPPDRRAFVTRRSSRGRGPGCRSGCARSGRAGEAEARGGGLARARLEVADRRLADRLRARVGDAALHRPAGERDHAEQLARERCGSRGRRRSTASDLGRALASTSNRGQRAIRSTRRSWFSGQHRHVGARDEDGGADQRRSGARTCRISCVARRPGGAPAAGAASDVASSPSFARSPRAISSTGKLSPGRARGRRPSRARTGCARAPCVPPRRRSSARALGARALSTRSSLLRRRGSPSTWTSDRRALRRRRPRAPPRVAAGRAARARARRASTPATTSGRRSSRLPQLLEDAEDGAGLDRQSHHAAACRRPRAWIACSTPDRDRFAIIDEPPTLTNGSGMPVIGAMPDRHPDVDEDLEEEREDDAAGDDRGERGRARRSRSSGRARRRAGRAAAGSPRRRSRAARRARRTRSRSRARAGSRGSSASRRRRRARRSRRRRRR